MKLSIFSSTSLGPKGSKIKNKKPQTISSPYYFKKAAELPFLHVSQNYHGEKYSDTCYINYIVQMQQDFRAVKIKMPINFRFFSITLKFCHFGGGGVWQVLKNIYFLKTLQSKIK